MAENFALYSPLVDRLPDDRMRALAGEAAFAVEEGEGRRRFVYQWPDLRVTVYEMPSAELPRHLDGFRGYVRHIYEGRPDERGERVLDRVGYSRLSAGVEIEPGRDAEGRALQLVGAMANGLQALVFHRDCLFDPAARLILTPDGRFDPEADVLGPVADMVRDRVQVRLPPSESPYQPTGRQSDRYDRVAAEMEKRRVPTFSGRLHLDDDEETTLRTPRETAERAIALWAVTVRADGGSREEAAEVLDRSGLRDALSPKERAFLEADEADEDEARSLLWRLEGLWALMWALGELPLPWPEGFGDVPALMAALRAMTTREDFLATAKLRPKAVILDAAQLTLLQHWAIRDAYVHQRPIPANLDWASPSQMAPVRGAPVTGVVAERHHALNWLTRFLDADWDDVETPT